MLLGVFDKFFQSNKNKELKEKYQKLKEKNEKQVD